MRKIEGRRCGRIEDCEGLRLDEGRVVPQNARRNPIKMHGPLKGLEKARRSAQQNLWVLQGSLLVA